MKPRKLRQTRTLKPGPKSRILGSTVAFDLKIGLCGGEDVSIAGQNAATHIKFHCVAQN
jgi:hypothetical protein